jgi:hypothetical protein
MSVSNIYIDQGSDFTTTLYINDSDGLPLDLTAYSVDAQIRKTYTSTEYVDFTSSIAIPSGSGQITISLSNIQTSNMISGRYVYDVVLTDPTSVKTRVVEGSATVNPGVTH